MTQQHTPPPDYTDAQKRAMYAAGHYRFRAPPVCTARWTDEDWITFIDAGRNWRPPQ